MWITPKTNWGPSDRFNATDYNRIKGNINVIKQLSLKHFADVPFTDMGADLTYSDFIYAEDINAFEDNLDSIERGTIDVNGGSKKNYYANQPFIDYTELNRIESMSLRLYDVLSTIQVRKERLKFRLGGGLIKC